jgi:hypothetical protein
VYCMIHVPDRMTSHEERTSCEGMIACIFDEAAREGRKKYFVVITFRGTVLLYRRLGHVYCLPCARGCFSKLQASRLCIHENSIFLRHFPASATFSLPSRRTTPLKIASPSPSHTPARFASSNFPCRFNIRMCPSAAIVTLACAPESLVQPPLPRIVVPPPYLHDRWLPHTVRREVASGRSA